MWEQAPPYGNGDGSASVVDAELVTGIADMKVDRALGNTQDEAGFPAGFSQR